MECAISRRVVTYCLGDEAEPWVRSCPRLDTEPLRESSSPVNPDDPLQVTCALQDVSAGHSVYATLNEDCSQWECTEYKIRA